ncbi:hypothetical protein [Streptomyces sp. NPDC054786]
MAYDRNAPEANRPHAPGAQRDAGTGAAKATLSPAAVRVTAWTVFIDPMFPAALTPLPPGTGVPSPDAGST